MRARVDLRRLLVVCGVGLTLAVPGPGARAQAEGEPTVVKKVTPVDADGALKPAYVVKHRYPGARCQSGSNMTGTAYRCFTSQAPDGVYDPCWVTDTGEHVICPGMPWKHKVVQLRVSDGFDNDDGFHKQKWPWGLRLTNDRHCLLSPAAVQFAGGRPIHYYCNKHVALAGHLDRSGARWRIHAYRNTTPHGIQPTYRSLGRLRVVVAWFGEPSRTG